MLEGNDSDGTDTGNGVSATDRLAVETESRDRLRSPSKGALRAPFAVSLVAVLGCALLGVVRVEQTSRGVATVRAVGLADLRAPQSGTVQLVETVVGARIMPGDLVISVFQRPATGEVSNIAFELRSPSQGSVAELSVRPGQWVQAGDAVATIMPDEPVYELLAAFPAADAPRLQPGQRASLTLIGFSNVTVELELTEVHRSIATTAEISRWIGRQPTEAFGELGVLARAIFMSNRFMVDGHRISIVSGMSGTVDAVVGTESFMSAVVAGLLN